jgi:hypothetical protein
VPGSHRFEGPHLYAVRPDYIDPTSAPVEKGA